MPHDGFLGQLSQVSSVHGSPEDDTASFESARALFRAPVHYVFPSRPSDFGCSWPRCASPFAGIATAGGCCARSTTFPATAQRSGSLLTRSKSSAAYLHRGDAAVTFCTRRWEW